MLLVLNFRGPDLGGDVVDGDEVDMRRDDAGG